MKNERIFRLLKMITLLSDKTRRWKAGDVAEFFGISERTFHRDRQILESLGVPLYYDKNKVTYEILDTFNFTPPEFTRDEALAMALAAQMAGGNNFPYPGDLKIALAKMLNSLPGSIQQVLENLDDKFISLHRAGVDLSYYQEEIRLIEKAINNKYTVTVDYHALGREDSVFRKIDPYSLVYENGAVYLVGYCHLRENIRIFRIDRMNTLEMSEEEFERPGNFSLDNYFKFTWGVEKGEMFTVELIFTGTAARLVQEFNWHPTQEIESLPGDKLLFRVKTCSMTEIKKWVLGFGSEVEVIKPEKLREDVVFEMKKMLENYE